MSGHSQTRLAGTILKDGLSQIREESIGLVHQVGNKNVFGPVSVKVTGINTHTSLCFAVSVEGRASQQRFILEGAVLLVNPKLVRITIVGDVDIRPAVTIKIGCHN